MDKDIRKPSTLDRLCELCGIEPTYIDVWGRRKVISDDTRQRLLAAMQIDAESESARRHAIASAEARVWQSLLEPVQVVRQSDPAVEVLIAVAQPNALQPLTWRLTLESGQAMSGTVVPADLSPKEEARIDDTRFGRYRWPLSSFASTPIQPGYHLLEIKAGNASESMRASSALRLIVAPETCHLPPVLAGEGRAWGPALQLYALRSQRNWGIGDFADLQSAIEFAAQSGAGMVGVNPLHALFPGQPERASPYSPSSRRFLNVLYLDVEGMPDFAECDAARNAVHEQRFQSRLAELRASELVQYREVGALKMQVLDMLYRHFRDAHLQSGSRRATEFRDFQAQQGEALRQHALFEALQEHLSREDKPVHGWLDWPEQFRHPEAPEVAAFAAGHPERIEYFCYLQWNAATQLKQIRRQVGELGSGIGQDFGPGIKLDIGLYLDMAVGVAADGAQAWSEQALYARAAYVGAPPDEFNQLGQNWGLPPLIPNRLREAAYAPFIEALRANMQVAGAIRLDHVMGLMRLYWVPTGGEPGAGGYVSYPWADLLGIVALESQRSRCMVIGEDLGTVPPELQDALQQSGILSYRIFFFERTDEGAFKPATQYQQRALVAVSTHDLPTLAGFWEGQDLELRSALGLFESDQSREAQVIDRAQQRAQLLIALDKEGLLPAGMNVHGAIPPAMSQELALAIHRFIARAPSKVMAIQMEDAFGQVQQVNLPAGGEQYPHWQRKLSQDIESWHAHPALQRLCAALARERGSGVPALLERGAESEAKNEAASASKAASNVNSNTVSIPRATYRLQFNHEFTFLDAAELIPYLHELGISHCYASPYFKARPGSMHGYDIIDHNALNPEIGSGEDFERYVAALQTHGMGQVLDIVPNHMGVMGSDNAWWLDVLENGQCAQHADFFDIDWAPQNPQLHGKLLLPVLGERYGSVLESGQLKLAFDAARGEFSIWYMEHRFPVDPRSYSHIIGHRLPHLLAAMGAAHPPMLELQSLLTAFERLPPHTETTPAQKSERNRDKEIHKRHLAALCESHAEIAAFIRQNVDEFNGGQQGAGRYDALHHLIRMQAYRLGYWRVASDEINYRRFFDIDSLAGLRVERQEVFDATHRLILDLLATGKIEGLRVDHPDGLFDPQRYFQRLQQAHRTIFSDRPESNGRNGASKIEAGSDCLDSGSLYLVVEKITAAYERLPKNWPVHGTTGYRFANVVNGIFVDSANEKRMDRVYAAFVGEHANFGELLYRSKKRIMETSLASELTVLANQLSRIAQMDRHTCDFTTNGLRQALSEVCACFPVYRTYVTPDAVSDEDRHFINWAVSAARKRSTAADTSVFDFVRDAMLTSLVDHKGAAYREHVTGFAMKFQQFSSPVMAKGMEDTSFYLYNRLVSLNEVGGDPRSFGLSLAAFHAANQECMKCTPHTMNATSTHDGKRSEDVRARINVLSELPALWRLRLRRWTRLNRSKKTSIDGIDAPSRNDEYLLYQTLIGAWPLPVPDNAGLTGFRERVEAYMLKAVREAKQHSSWINPDTEYEAALSKFVQALLKTLPLKADPRKNGARKNLFLADFLPFQRSIAHIGMLNSLSQTLIKLTAPGVPDTYQGNELWDFSLVDPDNRRAVDYRLRRTMLSGLHELFGSGTETVEHLQALLQTMEDGRIKMYLTWRVLQARRDFSSLFLDGDYVPLRADGEHAEHVCAFLRTSKGMESGPAALVLVPRLLFGLMGEQAGLPLGGNVWGNTSLSLPDALAEKSWKNLFTGVIARPAPGNGMFMVAGLLQDFPVALLMSD